MAPESTSAVYLVRAWWEDGEFRARITYQADLWSGAEISMVTAVPSEVRVLLDRWLEAIGEPGVR